MRALSHAAVEVSVLLKVSEMMRKLCATAAFLSLLICHALQAQSVAPPTPAMDAGTGIYDPSLDARVESLLSKMTLEEKVGQLA